MINFCEDCGKRNTLTPARFIEGKAVFKCIHCGYKNAYVIDLHKPDKLQKIDLFLNEIRTNTFIIGAFVFHLKKQVVINHMPDILKEADLAILGKLLADSYKLCLTEYIDIDGLILQVSEKLLTVQMVDQHVAIIIVTKNGPLSKTIKQQLSDFILTL